jgi:preprotein translocase subunit SecF
MLNILGKRYWFFGLSLLLIIPGLIILIVGGLPLSLDFKGGSLLEVSFESGKTPAPADIVNLYNDMDITDAQVQTTGENTLIIRSPFMSDETRSLIVQKMEEQYSDKVTIHRFESVGPTVGQEVASRATGAVALAALAVIIYISMAFRKLPHAFRYGVCAILAMVHDVAIVIALAAYGSRLWGWQIDSMYLTAMLTVIGFSVQDKIVVFDRIRENSNIHRKLPFLTLVNHSIVQTLQRSINTQLMTVEFMLLSLALFGGVTLREFSIVLLVGLFSGTYSSIFIAAPILVAWENKEWKTWFKKNNNQTASAS